MIYNMTRWKFYYICMKFKNYIDNSRNTILSISYKFDKIKKTF